MARALRSRSFLTPVAVVVAVLFAAGLTAVRAEPRPTLPEVPASQLVASALNAIAERIPVSGTVGTHIDLGLPQIASSLGDTAGPAGALLGDQTFKVWRSPDGIRVAQIVPFGERDVVANREDVWYWDSGLFTARHIAVPAGRAPPEPPSLGDLETLVGEALQAITPYAIVTEGDPTVVAGRDAYLVTLTPTSQDTLVGHMDLAIDAQTRVPLRFQVFAKGLSDPSVEVAFTSMGFGPVDPSVFEFTPPNGATVEEIGPQLGQKGDEPVGTSPQIRTFGEGFGMIVAVRLSRVSEVPKELRLLFPYAGPLGSAALVDRGDHVWLVAGAVPPVTLAEVEPKLP
jgi:outer membrane lipoprotein-sorting protein